MKKNIFRLLLFLLLTAFVLNGCKKEKDSEEDSNAYVTTLFEYLPAPGQLINTTAGNTEGAKSILGKEGLVSLGAWGGSITLGFDHTVVNREGQDDILVLGNASSNFAEPGVIWVMADDNSNGKPDDTWYEIAGSAYGHQGYIRNYSVTYTRPDPAGDVSWADNKGNSGTVKVNAAHTQPYYPGWITTNSYTVTGTLLPSDNIDDSNPSFIQSFPFGSGYADNAQGGDRIDLDNAIDRNGNKVHLKGIDFIKVQTGIQYNMGWVGELSTELIGIADLSLYK